MSTMAAEISMSVPVTLLSLAEASEIVGVTPGRLRQMIRAGTMQGVKIGKGPWAVTEDEARRIAAIPQKTGRPRGSRNA